MSSLCSHKTLADCGCEFQATDVFEPGKAYICMVTVCVPLYMKGILYHLACFVHLYNISRLFLLLHVFGVPLSVSKRTVRNLRYVFVGAPLWPLSGKFMVHCTKLLVHVRYSTYVCYYFQCVFHTINSWTPASLLHGVSASEFVTETYCSHDFVHSYVIPLQLPDLCIDSAWDLY